MLDKFSTLKFAFRARELEGMPMKPLKDTDFKESDIEKAKKKNSAFNVLFHAHVTKPDDSIEFYEYVAVSTKREIDWKKFKVQYGFAPQYEIAGTYVFMLATYVNKETYVNYLRSVCWAIDGKEEIGLLFPDTIQKEDGMPVVLNELFPEEYCDLTAITEFVRRLENQSLRKLGLERENVAAAENAMKLLVFEAVFKLLGTAVSSEGFIKGERGWFYDEHKRIVVDVTGKTRSCGNQFFFVLGEKNNDANETLLWFKGNTGTEVKVDVETVTQTVSEYEEYGFHITGGKGFVLQAGEYWTMSETPKRFTDFTVRVFHRIVNSDGTVDYVVQLENASRKTEKILYKHTSSANAIKDFVASYGNFHFFGSSSDCINQLHSAITEAHVSEVKAVLGYGFHNGKLVLRNGVFDLKTKELSISNREDAYVFDAVGNGYMPVTPTDVPMRIAYGDSACHKFNPEPEMVSAEAQYELFEKMYAGNVGLYMLMYAWGIMGYGMYSDNPELKYPFLMVHGVRGSGKTEYVELLRRIFRMEQSYNFETTSPFITATLFSSFSGLPVFLGEYREDAHSEKRKVKMSKLRSIYDKQSEVKGRSNQTTVTYPYVASLIIEGEEGISDSAMRSRCMVTYLTRANKLKDFSQFKKCQSSKIFENMLYSYLRKTKYDMHAYKAAYAEGMELFNYEESRLTNSMASIYAGCVTYAPHMKDKIIAILKEVFEIQGKDFVSNDPVTKFMKKIAYNLSNISDSYDVKGTRIILNATKIEEYFRVKRVELDLGSFDTYMGYCRDYGFEEDMHLFAYGMGRTLEMDMSDERMPDCMRMIPEFNSYKKKYANVK